MHALASSTGSLAHSCGERGVKRERAWYTLFVHALIISVIMHVWRYPRKYTGVFIMGVYKNTEIPKNVLENLYMPSALQRTLLRQAIVYLVNH